jgi:histone deacetylase complex regulatory component SIN3
LAWEDEESNYVINKKFDRLVFSYGESLKSVEDKIYERDLILSTDKILIGNE